MNILIDNAGFINKGAELMLYAAQIKLASIAPPSVFICRSRTPENLKKKIIELRQQKRQNLIPVKFLPLTLTKTFFGYAAPHHITHIVDAGGFRLGDQWVDNYSHDGIALWTNIYKAIKEKGGKNIFLPQAFGPFRKSLSREFIESIYPFVDLLIAREQESYNNLMEIFDDDGKIQLFPDFTNIYQPVLTDEEKNTLKNFTGRICIIPNSKMITHTEKQVADSYVSFMAQLAQTIKRKGYKVLFLNHEGNADENLIKQIIKETREEFDSVSGLNADQVKWLIRESKLVVTSRFHGLVSALSQGVPAFCTSWSHKYHELLKDYEQEKNLLDVRQPIEGIEKLLSLLDSNESMAKTRIVLNKNAEIQKQKSLEMWNKVEKILMR